MVSQAANVLGNVNFKPYKGIGERKRGASPYNTFLIWSFDHHASSPLEAVFACSIMPQIWCVPGHDRPNVITLLAFLKQKCGTSISFPLARWEFHRHLETFRFWVSTQTRSACLRESRQTSSPSKYGGFPFFRYSLGFGLPFMFDPSNFLGDCGSRIKWVFYSGYMDRGVFKWRWRWQRNVMYRCFWFCRYVRQVFGRKWLTKCIF